MRSRRFTTGTTPGQRPKPRGSRFGAASLVLLGLILGLAISLYYAWIVEPVSYIAAGPSRLNDEYKDEYILLVSSSYAVDGDWQLARERLKALDDEELENTVTDQLERYLRAGEPAETLRNLAVVAEKLGSRSPAVAVFVPIEVTQATRAVNTRRSSPTSTLNPTSTPAPPSTAESTPIPTTTAQPTATSVPVFRLLKQERICRRDSPIPLIEVIVYDAFLEPLPGVEVLVSWEGGSDHFYTGYQPGQGPGYGDFLMSPETVYRVELAEGSTVARDLATQNCGEELGGLAGGWRLTFQNSDVTQRSTSP